MESAFILNQFDQIEQKVEIQRLEEEIQGKVEAENSYAEEKALIRSKIDGLLAKLDEVANE